jgi:hypothetical protein
MMSSRVVPSPGGIKIALLAAAVITVVSGGCSSTADNGSEAASTTTSRSASASPSVTPSPSPSSTPSSAAEAARQKAIAAYLGMWQDFAEAGETSDWDSPRLGDHASGDALLTMSRALYADHYNGLVTKGTSTNNPTVSSATPAAAPKTVMISDCGDDSRALKYDAKTGKLANDAPGGKRAMVAEVKLHKDGSWRVTRFAVQGVGSC